MNSLSDRTWIWFAAALYLTGFVLGTISVFRERRHSRALMYVIISAGFTLQTWGLYLRGLQVGGCPIGNRFEIFQFTAWSATALYLVVGATFRLSLLGYFTSCLAATLTLVSLLVPAWDAAKRVNIFGGNAWIEFHAALALFSYGVFALLALTSVMYLLQVFSLQRRHLHGLFSFLPSMVDLDHINLRLLTTGVVLMSSSLAVGAVYWFRDTSTVDKAKLYVTVAVWAAYAVTWLLRWRSFLVAKRFAWTCVALFAAALISLGPVNSSRKPLPGQAAHQAR
jgi:HemX protein